MNANIFKIFGNEFHIDEQVLTWTLVGFSLINGLGSSLWGLLSDYVSFKVLFCSINILEVLVAANYYFLSRHSVFYVINNFCLALCLAGNFALFPQYVGKLFPSRVASQVYGLIFVGFSTSTFIGAVVCFFLLKEKEDYLYAYITGGVFAIIAFVLNFIFNEDRTEFVEFRNKLNEKEEKEEEKKESLVTSKNKV